MPDKKNKIKRRIDIFSTQWDFIIFLLPSKFTYLALDQSTYN
jgi:hypothetical protein